MGHLQGKTAIITGGGRAVLSDGSCGSIGYGIATAYAKEGANLVITGRNVKKLEDAKEELERLYGIKVLPVAADVSAGSDNETAVQNVVKQAVDTFGRIDVLRGDAGRSHDRAVRPGCIFRAVRSILLHEGLLSVLEGNQGLGHQFRIGSGAVRKLRAVCLRCCKGRDSRSDSCSCYGMGS